MFWVATEISIIRFCHYLGFFPLGKPMHVGARKSRVWRLQVTGVKYAHNYLHKEKLYNESIGITLTKHVGHPEVKKLYYPPLFFKWILQRFLLITHTWNCWVVCWKLNWNCVSVKKSSVKELKRNKDRVSFLLSGTKSIPLLCRKKWWGLTLSPRFGVIFPRKKVRAREKDWSLSL